MTKTFWGGSCGGLSKMTSQSAQAPNKTTPPRAREVGRGRTCLPCRMRGMAAFCTGVGCRMPRLSHTRHSHGLSPVSWNAMGLRAMRRRWTGVGRCRAGAQRQPKGTAKAHGGRQGKCIKIGNQARYWPPESLHADGSRALAPGEITSTVFKPPAKPHLPLCRILNCSHHPPGGSDCLPRHSKAL